MASASAALCLALRYLDGGFEEMMRFVIDCGCDVDTIGAMAGALWGGRNGAADLPAVPLEARARLESIASRLHRHAVSASSPAGDGQLGSAPGSTPV